MTMLNLQSKKVTPSTAKEIRLFIGDNFKTISIELFNFYDLVAGLIELQLTKKVAYRMTMAQILDRSFNFETNLLKEGGAGLEINKIEATV